MEMEKEIILKSIEKIKQDLRVVESKFNSVTEPILIDSCIYELKALHMQHKFYMQLCKERKINFI